jgi:hypothetical protein
VDDFLENLREYYRKADVATKEMIPGCIFDEKLDEWLRAQSAEHRALCEKKVFVFALALTLFSYSYRTKVAPREVRF